MQSDKCPNKQWEGNTDTCTKKEPCEERGRERSKATTSQGMQSIARQTQPEARKTGGFSA